MKIPTRFRLLGQTIQVVWKDEMVKEDDNTGQARYRFNEVAIQRPSQAYPRTQEQVEQTFCHELVHWLLYRAEGAHTGKKDWMHQEEDFVDLLAGLLHQSLTSMEYEEDSTEAWWRTPQAKEVLEAWFWKTREAVDRTSNNAHEAGKPVSMHDLERVVRTAVTNFIEHGGSPCQDSTTRTT
jgi:hypothetical protein